MNTIARCQSTAYGPGCGHYVTDHTGPRTQNTSCCCCNWQHNDPEQASACSVCKPMHDAMDARRRCRTLEQSDRVYSHAGTVAHLKRYGSEVYASVCGWSPEWPDSWRGTGSQDEYDKAARLPLCKRCGA